MSTPKTARRLSDALTSGASAEMVSLHDGPVVSSVVPPGAISNDAFDAPDNGRADARVWSPPSVHRSIAARWASLMHATLQVPHDPKTVVSWARSIGVSRSALCECCRLVHVSPHDARDFVRLLRAICRSGRLWQPETLLDLADVRTLRKLLTRAGLTGDEVVTPTIEQFLGQQQWIPQANPALAVLRELLANARHARDARDHRS